MFIRPTKKYCYSVKESRPPHTQEELGKLVGTSKRVISYFEREAKNPTIETINKLAEVLGVQPERLLKPTEETQNEPKAIRSLQKKLNIVHKLPPDEQRYIAKNDRHHRRKKWSATMNLPAVHDLKNFIHNVRGKAVMLDRDLADLYGVETRALNQAVKRNALRFPEDFMFALTREEIQRISQTVTSLKFSKSVNVFTEQGVAMLSSVLNSEQAIQVNISIMRAFVQVRRLGMTIVDVKRKIDSIEKKYDHQFKIVFDAIRQLLAPPPALKKNQKMGFGPTEKK